MRFPPTLLFWRVKTRPHGGPPRMSSVPQSRVARRSYALQGGEAELSGPIAYQAVLAATPSCSSPPSSPSSTSPPRTPPVRSTDACGTTARARACSSSASSAISLSIAPPAATVSFGTRGHRMGLERPRFPWTRLWANEAGRPEGIGDESGEGWPGEGGGDGGGGAGDGRGATRAVERAPRRRSCCGP